MIIKSHSIRTRTAQRVTAYVLAIGDNEAVELIEGAADALLDADAFAATAGHKNGLLHITISPDEDLSLEDLSRSLTAINDEFGFDPNDPYLLVRHVSARANGLKLPHYHLLRPAADFNGRVYDVYRSKKKDEVVSRMMEIKLRHKITSGKHNGFVHDRFVERGLTDYAAQISSLIDKTPRAVVGAKQHQKSKRSGFDVVLFTREMKLAAKFPVRQQAQAVALVLANHDDLTVTQGVKNSRILIKKNGEVMFNANKILKIPTADVRKFVEQIERKIENAKTHQNGNEDTVYSKCSPRLARNNNTKSASDHRGQLHHQEQHGRDCEVTRGATGGLNTQQLSTAARNVAPMAEDLKAAVKGYSEASIEPMPDLNDPYLMMKLSRALQRSVGPQEVM